MTSKGKMAGLRTVKHGTVTACPHRNELMNSHGSTVHSSPEAKTAKCSVDIEISGRWPLHTVRYYLEGGAPTHMGQFVKMPLPQNSQTQKTVSMALCM